MKRKYFLWLPPLLAFYGVSCAPVEETASEASPPEAAALRQPTKVARLPAVGGGLKERVEAALEHVHRRDLLTTHAFWTIFHGILGTGLDATLLDPETGRRVNAIEHIRTGGEVRGLQFIPTRHGLDVRIGPQFVGQGHQDQFVAEMVQWGLAPETKFTVHGKEYTFADFLNHSKMRTSVKSGQELSWAIIIIGQFSGTDATWTNEEGDKLRFEDVLRYELNEPIDSAACGGTHRLFGLTWVYHLHLQRGGKTEGVWNDVAEKLTRYQGLARKYRNPDGTFSTKFLAGPGNVRDVQLRISTTGHVFEWLTLTLTDAELRAPWVQESANALSLLILDSQGSPIEGGALYHATHGLHIYHDRVFGPLPGRRGPQIPLPPERMLVPPQKR
jgi:hypothetical protein